MPRQCYPRERWATHAASHAAAPSAESAPRSRRHDGAAARCAAASAKAPAWATHVCNASNTSSEQSPVSEHLLQRLLVLTELLRTTPPDTYLVLTASTNAGPHGPPRPIRTAAPSQLDRCPVPTGPPPRSTWTAAPARLDRRPGPLGPPPRPAWTTAPAHTDRPGFGDPPRVSSGGRSPALRSFELSQLSKAPPWGIRQESLLGALPRSHILSTVATFK